jgi:Na+/H+ antiporter NhaD/arsenite permease-like protein
MNRDHNPWADRSTRAVLLGIAVILALYLVLAFAGLPQKGTAVLQEAHAQHQEESHDGTASETAAPEARPPYWTVLPFAVLLGLIAVLPLVPATEHWWENNLHKFYAAAALAAITLAYYLVWHAIPVEGHWPASHTVPAATGLNLAATWAVLATAVLKEYLPFILMLFSLYTISGGIRLEGDLPAHPATKTVVLTVGGVLARLIGTTGAAMVLIPFLLDTNSERKHVSHTVVFFIFIVCNCGGCLLPTGDPPLFLGYLRGVDFLWTLRLWPEWLFVNGLLLVIYYLCDRYWYYPHETAADVLRDETQVRPPRLSGLWPNALLLPAVVAAVALFDPGKTLPGTDWHPWLHLREVALLALVGLSLLLENPQIRRANQFNYGAILEVAALFLGIFVCMQPALQILDVEGQRLGLTSPTHFFWVTGALSSVLDNAPTYVVFFEAARPAVDKLPGATLLVAISLGAVFMGANTYIGNGPNFMVRTIAEKSGVRMPSFFGYMLYSGLILLPIFALTNWLFLR